MINVYSKIDRCSICFLHKPLCICEQAKSIQVNTKVKFHFVVHANEWKTVSNTVRILEMLLINKEIYTFADGNQSIHTSWEKLPKIQGSKKNVAILFPLASVYLNVSANVSPDTDAPTNAAADTITDLIIPDGNWTNAKRIAKKIHLATGAPFIAIKSDRKSSYRLREQPKENFLSTYEATILAIKYFESDSTVQMQIEELFSFFDKFVERSLWVNGRIAEEDLKYPLDKSSKQFYPRKFVP
ncbi:MAG: DTW domain-containing protein [Oligoflexia bacterium]|nr:DTW domain-containing protein [Oligoflexia bacterium]